MRTTKLDPMDVAIIALTAQRIELEAQEQRSAALRNEVFVLLERQMLHVHEAALEMWDEDQLEKIGGRH